MKRMIKRNKQLTQVKIRPATLADLAQLVEVENLCFDYDQLSRRSFHWMITQARSIFLVIELKQSIIGYGLVLINRGTSLARLYSICLLEDYQGMGLAGRLLDLLEDKAAEANCAYLRLEVKKSNQPAIGLYRKRGYVKYAQKEHYYDDGETAWCFEKQIMRLKKSPRLIVPYHQQGTDFTCGPACLLMAFKALNPQFEMTLSQELQLWREATTIFMTSGHGGCGPQGLALASWNRGYGVELYLSHKGPMFLETVRSAHKKSILELVHKDFEKKLSKIHLKTFHRRMFLKDLKKILEQGGLAIVLITTYQFHSNRCPHWVIVTAYDDGFVFIHDPDREWEFETVVSKVHLPIPEDQFLRISCWGKQKYSATVAIYPKSH